jgi:hypothetical protein
MKRKYFLTQAQIRQIVKHYGGFYRYQYNPNVKNEYDRLYLCQKSNKYLWLCIFYNYKKDLIEVTLTNDTGLIIQRDNWINKDNEVKYITEYSVIQATL